MLRQIYFRFTEVRDKEPILGRGPRNHSSAELGCKQGWAFFFCKQMPMAPFSGKPRGGRLNHWFAPLDEPKRQFVKEAPFKAHLLRGSMLNCRGVILVASPNRRGKVFNYIQVASY